MKDFAGKVVWLTGASSGIGEALAYELAKQGALLVLSARREERLEAVRARCARPEQHLVLPFDIVDIDAHVGLTARVLERYGRIDMLINNAGVSQRSLVQETQLSVDRKLFEIDYFAPVSLIKAVLPQMLKNGAGSLVAVASVAGLVSTPLRSSYGAAKAALLAFHDSLRAEVHDAGLEVSVICPGWVDTDIATSALVGDGSPSAGRHQQPPSALTAEACAREAVAGLRAGKPLIVVAGREKVLWYLSRVSRRVAGVIVRNVKTA